MNRHFNCKLSIGEDEQVIKIYQSGFHIAQIAKAYGTGRKAIAGALKRNNIQIRHGGKNACGKLLSDTEEKIIGQIYNFGISGEKISKAYGLSTNVIFNAIHSQDIKVRSSRIHSINENAFDNLDNEHALYFLGFIYADGYVSKHELKIGLAKKDEIQLYKIINFLKSTAVVTSRQNAVHVNFASNYLVGKLTSYGIIPKRGEFYKLIDKIPKQLQHHFIRGYLDGDGCISTNEQVVILGQIDILSWIRDTFYNEIGTSINTIRQRNGICEISWGGINQANKIIDYLYNDATVYLKRKKNIADNWRK